MGPRRLHPAISHHQTGRHHRKSAPIPLSGKRNLKESWRPGLATARAGPLPTWMKAMDLGNRAYRSSSLTVTVTRP